MGWSFTNFLPKGHQGAISALAFSPDAKFVATCSLQDQTVRVWYSNLSLLGVLTSSLSQGLARNDSSNDNRESGSQKAYKVFSFALPHGGEQGSHFVVKNVTNRYFRYYRTISNYASS